MKRKTIPLDGRLQCEGPCDVIKKVIQFATENHMCPSLPESSQVQHEPLHWKELKEYPGYYLCPHGCLISAKRKKLKIMKIKQDMNHSMTSVVRLGSSTKSVHKLITATFEKQEPSPPKTLDTFCLVDSFQTAEEMKSPGSKRTLEVTPTCLFENQALWNKKLSLTAEGHILP